MIIRNAYAYNGEGFEKRDLYIAGERFCREEDYWKETDDTAADTVIDAEGFYAIPGLIDLHFHGAMGRDFCDASEESIQIISEFEASCGVLAICPATMTYSEEILRPIMEAAASYQARQAEEEQVPGPGAHFKGADLVGINMEGPFISPGKVGAQNPKYVSPADTQMFDRLQEKSGHLIRVLDIAPEENGNLDFIKENADKIRISLAHTCTDYDTAKAAFAAGAKQVTHLFNAMPGIGHRNPGPVIAALEEKDVMVELITDGIHIHPAMVRFVFQVFGADRVILISDSLECTGLPDGEYTLGGQAITLKNRKAVLTEHPETIAGSSATLFDCMRRAVREMGISLEEAVKAASSNPARALGIEQDYGSLDEGRLGNVLLLNEELELIKVIQKGVQRV